MARAGRAADSTATGLGEQAPDQVTFARSGALKAGHGPSRQIRYQAQGRWLEGSDPDRDRRGSSQWLDAKVEKVRAGGRVEHRALVVAYGVDQSGRREVLGIDVGEAETEAFWRELLRGLRARGLAGVRLCVSDAHQGLKTAIAQVLGCSWQRCTVHFLRD